MMKKTGLLFLISLLSACESTPNIDSVKAASPTVVHYNQVVAGAQSQPHARLEEGYIEHNGLRLHYVTGGRGKLVVFYHGFPGYWYIWKNQLADLSDNYRVVAFDALGANLSDKPPDLDAYRIKNLAGYLQYAIQTLNPDQQPYVLIGHDWGGALAWAYAQQNPSGLEKLVVLSAPPYNQFLDLLQHNPEQRKASAYVNRLKTKETEQRLSANQNLQFWQIGGFEKMAKNGHLSPAEAELFRTALSRPGVVKGGLNWYKANVPEFSDISDQDYWPDQNARTQVKSLMIWGEKDRVFVPEFLQDLQRYASNVQIELLPELGHVPHLRAPEQVNRLIRNFIEQP